MPRPTDHIPVSHSVIRHPSPKRAPAHAVSHGAAGHPSRADRMVRIGLSVGLLFALIYTMASPVLAQTRQFDSEHGPFKVDEIARFNHGWGMAFIDSNRLLVTERDGALWLVDLAKGSKTEVKPIPAVYAAGQGGLLDVALAPDFNETGWVYFTSARDGAGGSGTLVHRARLNTTNSGAPTLSDHQDLYAVKPSRPAQHFGSRLAFAPDGTLFVTFGDHGERTRAQDVSNAAGAVIRINPDGSIPKDNPTFATQHESARAGLWSIGHRNPQGATIHPTTGALYTVEHGARGGDEINQPRAGKNYGWPVISYGRHYSGAKIGEGTKRSDMEQPLYYWDPSIAPSGLDFYEGSAFPDWNGNLFVGALKDQKLVRLVLDGDRVVKEEHLIENAYGRIRDVRSGPDGMLWLLTDSPEGRLLRLSPGN